MSTRINKKNTLPCLHIWSTSLFNLRIEKKEFKISLLRNFFSQSWLSILLLFTLLFFIIHAFMHSHCQENPTDSPPVWAEGISSLPATHHHPPPTLNNICIFNIYIGRARASILDTLRDNMPNRLGWIPNVPSLNCKYLRRTQDNKKQARIREAWPASYLSIWLHVL